MGAPFRILLGTIAAFVLIALGFALGLYVYERGEREPVAQVTKADIKPRTEPNHHTYEVSPPSIGVMLEHHPIEIDVQGERGFATLPAAGTGEIKTGQKVFLYDANGGLLMSMGEIINIKEIPQNMIAVEMNFGSNPDVTPGMVTKGNIIVNRRKDVSRLPYSALVKDKDGALYVWEVEKSREGISTGHYKKANVTGGNDLFFAIEKDMESSSIFILNPDNRLVDGDIINTRMAYYDAPSQSEDEKIESVAERRRSSALAAREAENMIYNKTGGAAPSAAGSPSCGQSPNATASFIAKIKAMGQKQGNGGASPSGCP